MYKTKYVNKQRGEEERGATDLLNHRTLHPWILRVRLMTCAGDLIC